MAGISQPWSKAISPNADFAFIRRWLLWNIAAAQRVQAATNEMNLFVISAWRFVGVIIWWCHEIKIKISALPCMCLASRLALFSTILSLRVRHGQRSAGRLIFFDSEQKTRSANTFYGWYVNLPELAGKSRLEFLHLRRTLSPGMTGLVNYLTLA